MSMTIAGVLPTLAATMATSVTALQAKETMFAGKLTSAQSAYDNADDQGGQSVGQLGQMLGQVGQMAQQAGRARAATRPAGGPIRFDDSAGHAVGPGWRRFSGQLRWPVRRWPAVRPVKERAGRAPLRRRRRVTMEARPRAVVRAAGARGAGTRGTGAGRQGCSASARPRHRRSRTPRRGPGAGRRTATRRRPRTQHVIAEHYARY